MQELSAQIASRDAILQRQGEKLFIDLEPTVIDEIKEWIHIVSFSVLSN